MGGTYAMPSTPKQPRAGTPFARLCTLRSKSQQSSSTSSGSSAYSLFLDILASIAARDSTRDSGSCFTMNVDNLAPSYAWSPSMELCLDSISAMRSDSCSSVALSGSGCLRISAITS
eukprot:scaffold15760_cov123-Isochrysis_galbana.AAC.1